MLMSTVPVEVEALPKSNDGSEWDRFVFAHPEATFFHRYGWRRVLQRTYGGKQYYLVARRNAETVGILPLGHVKSALFGNSLVSVPFCVGGGIVADDDAVAHALLDRATEIGQSLKVANIELRSGTRMFEDLPSSELYVNFERPISDDDDLNLKAIPRKQRAVVRKAIGSGLVGDADQEVDRFYALYSESVRNLGTPVHRIDWYRNIKAEFANDCEVLTITKDGEPISTVMSYYFRDRVLPYYGGGGTRARELRSNDFMYWDLMCRAARRGSRVFDYGRSKKGTGSYSFKKNWGFEPRPLHYEFKLIRGTSVPEINPLNPKYRLFVEMWKRMPLGFSRIVGPYLARSLA